MFSAFATHLIWLCSANPCVVKNMQKITNVVICFSQIVIGGKRLGFQCTAESYGARRNNLLGVLLFLALNQSKQWFGFNILISKNSSMSQNGEQDKLFIFSSCAVKVVVVL